MLGIEFFSTYEVTLALLSQVATFGRFGGLKMVINTLANFLARLTVKLAAYITIPLRNFALILIKSNRRAIKNYYAPNLRLRIRKHYIA